MLDAVLPRDLSLQAIMTCRVPTDVVCLVPTLRVNDHTDALTFYERLRAANRAVECDFFECIVMKRADSPYPVQIRSPSEEFRGWCKHRFIT